eukprot:Gregarina_sp_Poly_1__8938@NODE_540_length_7609_cov_134_992840_g427_i0_p2_GENE_NODE_540_length_7609_cov_134_992840_g427_i0NODE_540_length_7609_cov_134_992840_g427_i0_p2_ORF_typecomplete_len847_score154_56MAD/PF05557_13/0_00039MAD/PF05557_13/0_031MAD/PF05557_13/6_2MAD/PF05557_13/10Fez1/PF06818_15/1_7e02Fez1/PF06818_15/0_00078Fez1/PF06818_15/2_8e02Fez1/PF06818_15/19CLZ/PF16526_5/4e02CLZ/PF16526_5/1_5e02CLZ/PF16526_5/1_3e03CLZ/PF16526_5/4_5e03CLZ/PF16526_5/2_7e03CLZ/PF16526_5/0_0088Filament/PF00038_
MSNGMEIMDMYGRFRALEAEASILNQTMAIKDKQLSRAACDMDMMRNHMEKLIKEFTSIQEAYEVLREEHDVCRQKQEIARKLANSKSKTLTGAEGVELLFHQLPDQTSRHLIEALMIDSDNLRAQVNRLKEELSRSEATNRDLLRQWEFFSVSCSADESNDGQQQNIVGEKLACSPSPLGTLDGSHVSCFSDVTAPKPLAEFPSEKSATLTSNESLEGMSCGSQKPNEAIEKFIICMRDLGMQSSPPAIAMDYEQETKNCITDFPNGCRSVDAKEWRSKEEMPIYAREVLIHLLRVKLIENNEELCTKDSCVAACLYEAREIYSVMSGKLKEIRLDQKRTLQRHSDFLSNASESNARRIDAVQLELETLRARLISLRKRQSDELAAIPSAMGTEIRILEQAIGVSEGKLESLKRERDQLEAQLEKYRSFANHPEELELTDLEDSAKETNLQTILRRKRILLRRLLDLITERESELKETYAVVRDKDDEIKVLTEQLFEKENENQRLIAQRQLDVRVPQPVVHFERNLMVPPPPGSNPIPPPPPASNPIPPPPPDSDPMSPPYIPPEGTAHGSELPVGEASDDSSERKDDSFSEESEDIDCFEGVAARVARKSKVAREISKLRQALDVKSTEVNMLTNSLESSHQQFKSKIQSLEKLLFEQEQLIESEKQQFSCVIEGKDREIQRLYDLERKLRRSTARNLTYGSDREPYSARTQESLPLNTNLEV